MNILNNARQAIPEQGEIAISTEQQGEMVSVSIRDNGIGIPENMRNRIFEPFFTIKAPGIATGLGLSLSYGIMSKIGGAIQCHSTLGQGRSSSSSSPPPWILSGRGNLSISRRSNRRDPQHYSAPP
jgi:two-component system, NtrC family, sensor kinase